jgi:hypothetical protein
MTPNYVNGSIADYIEDDASAVPPGPHVVTPEIAAEANRQLAASHGAIRRAQALSKSIEGLEKLRDDAYESSRQAQRRAHELLMGPPLRF